MPPFAVPSSLVRTTPVTVTASVNTRAWTTPFWPVGASRTSSTSVTGATFSTTRLILPSSSIRPPLVCSRPAVSTTTVSTSPSTPVRAASKATEAGSAPSRPRTVRTPTRSPQGSSWSAAAARKVSAAPRTTLLPSPTSTRAILPTVVVLPAPLTPTTRTIPGRPSCRSTPRERSRSGPSTAVSSRTSSCRSWGPEAVASTIDWVRSRSTICWVAATPTSAASRVSSTSSQSSSVSRSRARTVSRPRPRFDWERASRDRSFTSRPADGGGVSKTRPGSGAAGGGSTSGGASGETASGSAVVPIPLAVAPEGRGGASVVGGRGRVSVVPAAASSSSRVVRRPRPTSRLTPRTSPTSRIAIAISTNSMALSLPAPASGVRAEPAAVGHPGRHAAARPGEPGPPPRSTPAARRPGVGHRVGGDRPALRGHGARPQRPHLPRRRSPLRPRRRRGARAGQRHALRGPPRRRARVARGVVPLPAQPHPDAGAARPVPHRVRLLPLRHPQHRRRRRGHPAGRAGHLRRAAPGAAGGGVARRAGAAGRPGLRRRADAGDPALAVAAPAATGPAGRPGRRLRGVHPALRGVLERPAGALAAVHRPVLDDLRRPRDDRRLEHLRRLAPRGGRAGLVDPPDLRRPGQLLGLPAPGQPQPAGAGRERHLAGGAGSPGRRRAGAAGDGRGRRPGSALGPLELRAALGRGADDHDRQPGRPGARRVRAADARRGGVHLGRGGDAPRRRRGRRAPGAGHLAAVAAAARHPRGGAVERDARPAAPRTSAGLGLRAAPAGRRPRALGGVRRLLRAAGPCPGRAGPVRAGPGAGDRAGPLRRRPPRLRRRARGPRRSGHAGAPADRVAAAQPGSAPDPGGLPDRLEPLGPSADHGAVPPGAGPPVGAGLGQAGRPVLRQPARRAGPARPGRLLPAVRHPPGRRGPGAAGAGRRPAAVGPGPGGGGRLTR